MNTPSSIVALYVVKTPKGYLAGFDTQQQKPMYVSDVLLGKKFSHKFDIKLRPGEEIVEITVDLADSKTKISDPFVPAYWQRRFTENHPECTN